MATQEGPRAQGPRARGQGQGPGARGIGDQCNLPLRAARSRGPQGTQGDPWAPMDPLLPCLGPLLGILLGILLGTLRRHRTYITYRFQLLFTPRWGRRLCLG